MRHYFRINVAGEGYVLYAGDLRRGLRPQPLAVASAEVSPAFLRTQARLDEVLGQRQLSLAICAPSAPGRGGPVVAYGGWFQAPDEHGRPGLVLVHGLELDDAEWICPCVGTILTRLSAAATRELGRELRPLAAQKAGPAAETYLRRTAEAVESAVRQLFASGARAEKGTGADIAAVEHDCAGAAPVAWLTLAASQTWVPAPWEMFDRVGADGQTETCVHPPRGRRVPASQLLLGTAFTSESRFSSRPCPTSPEKDDRPEAPPRSVAARPSGWAKVWMATAAALLLTTGCASYLAVEARKEVDTQKTAAAEAQKKAESADRDAAKAIRDAEHKTEEARKEEKQAQEKAARESSRVQRAEQKAEIAEAKAADALKVAQRAEKDMEAARQKINGVENQYKDTEKMAKAAKEAVEKLKTEVDSVNLALAKVNARMLVHELYDKEVRKEAVLKALETLPEQPLKTQALAQAKEYIQNPVTLRHASWGVVCRPGDTPEAYRRALLQAQEAYRLVGDNDPGLYRTTLGLAQYRDKDYKAAVKTLEEARKSNKDVSPYAAADVAFLAMAHANLSGGKNDKERKSEFVKIRGLLEKLQEIRDRAPLAEAWPFWWEATKVVTDQEKELKP